jgi:hypothetical protein
MPVTVLEKFESRAGDRKSLDLIYSISGTDSDATARTEMLSAAPGFHDGLKRLDESAHVEPVGNNLWQGTVRYEKQEPTPASVGESSFTFDTGGGTQHITQSLSTVGSYAPAGNTPPNFGGAIGVTHDSVEGVDITVPVYTFTETHIIAASTVNNTYKGNLFRLTGRVNNAGFKGTAAGECLFLGAAGSKRGTDDWEITFRFAASPNRTDLAVGDITVASKKGWEYLWVRYADAEDAGAKMLIKKPVAAYVEKVYEEDNFALLGIGT